jgi:hypothetical protein
MHQRLQVGGSAFTRAAQRSRQCGDGRCKLFEQEGQVSDIAYAREEKRLTKQYAEQEARD